ncbi:MAG: thioredoxin domain-containing protein [Acidobacteriota bacterium]|nr:thioredoxin domain-containing protein [Acidobacteriota bacterium]
MTETENRKPMRKRWRFSIACLLALLTVGGSLALIRTRGQKSQDVAPAAREGKPNRLIKEKSPYLLQHAHNPVDWYPWGEEAFEKARRENKPVFLSIGYSTCHWCHVMEAESFSDTQVASLMNDAFVSIKVDREERPDIDNVYMNVSVLMTGSGGWPLTIIMTPDKRPFFVATYIPKDGRFGQAGLLDLIPRVKEAWATQHERILQSATQITSALQQKTSNSSGADPDTSTLQAAYQQLKSRFDERYGGFGQSQKFPTPHNFLFLLRYWKRTGDAKALEMVERTLQAMRRGGMYDHVGFGFHRYSTEPTWLVPHFEKMLYDQALLAMAYTEAFQATGKEEYEKTAREIFTYVLRDMTSASGGFYSAEDADSEGEEGKFYLWSEKEIRQALGKEDADLFVKVFGVQSGGNFTEQSTGNKSGTNILYLSKPLRETAADLKLPEQQLRNRLELSRQKLFAVREKRIHPGKDDKILVDWNGLMIAALAKGAQAFNEPKYLEAAMRAADFIQRNVRTSDGRLLHRYRDGQANIKAHAEDYAFLIWGLLELHEATFQINYLRAALDLNNELLKHFWDANRGGFYFSADDGEALLVRSKEIYDGAIPSGNSVAMLNLLRLGRITANTDFEQKAAAIGRAFSGEIKSSPSASTQLMVALDFGIGPSYEVVIAGGSQAEDTRAMLNALRIGFIPNKVVLLKPTDQKEPEITRLAAFTKYQSSRDGKATAYVCLNYNCKLPTTEINKMLDLLAGK